MIEHVPPHWYKHLPAVKAGLQECGGSHTADDLLAALRSGEMVWYASDDAFVVIEILRHPRLTVMNCVLAGGDLEMMPDITNAMERQASRLGVDVIEIVGRAGWARVFKDYERAGIILRKVVHHG